ncbi:MAG: hypothetical protein ACI9U2_004202 [Bradymonadia bacterium]|jgi:hypothetical protein
MTRLIVWAALIALLPAPAAAFCGFFVSGADSKLYNNASQVVLMRKGQRTVLTMSNTYKGPTEDFAMVVPVPTVLQKDQVKTLPADVFSKIDQLSAPRLVEYWEQDPCYLPPPPRKFMASSPGGGRPTVQSAPSADRFGVKVEAQFTVGEYEIVILSANEANGLEGWLKANKYNIPAGAGEALAPYIQSGQKFFVAKVNIKKVKRDTHGDVVLSPLRFHYEDAQLRLPVRLGLLNASGKQDLIVYVLHPTSRFEAANYKNVFIPSNLEVLDDVRKGFGAFYAALFDRTLEKAGGRAVVTEYAWQTSSCDPCPVPPLQPSDIYTLGGDVFGAGKGSAAKQPRRPGQPFFGPSSSWVLTRMHTRYDKKSLDEDLIFVEAKPVVGGRGSAGLSREKPGAVNMSSVNNFQGRYIMRNYWAGKVTCENPRWGRWGGPPNGGNKIKAASDLANAPRGAVELAKTVRSALPELGIKGMPTPARKTSK